MTWRINNVPINHIKNHSVRSTYERILPLCKMFHSSSYVDLRMSNLDIMKNVTPHDLSIMNLETSC